MIRILILSIFSLVMISCAKYEKEYHDNGEIKLKYKTDKKNNWTGLVKQYYQSGDLEFECEYIEGAPDGIAKFYYKNGDLKTTKVYQNGTLDGISHWYDSLGFLNYSELYSNDTLVNYFYYNRESEIIDGWEQLDINFKPNMKDFKITFLNSSDTLKAGESVIVDARHASILPYQIKLRFSNGRMTLKRKPDSVLYNFTPKRIGESSVLIFVEYDSDSLIYVGRKKYPVIE
jgi:hypothetical protein